MLNYIVIFFKFVSKRLNVSKYRSMYVCALMCLVQAGVSLFATSCSVCATKPRLSAWQQLASTTAWFLGSAEAPPLPAGPLSSTPRPSPVRRMWAELPKANKSWAEPPKANKSWAEPPSARRTTATLRPAHQRRKQQQGRTGEGGSMGVGPSSGQW